MNDRDLSARIRNLKASRFLYRVDVVARLESEDDIAFLAKGDTRCASFTESEILPCRNHRNPRKTTRENTLHEIS